MTQMTTERFRRYVLLGRDGADEEIVAELLGEGTSFREGKTRWFDVALYREQDGGYVVHTIGRSVMLNERDLARIVRTTSPYEIVELLTVTHRQQTYVPRASTLALAQAAAKDDGVRQAYLRMVA